ncbi:MAG: hypothetical protein H8D47_04840, partial [Planctomycetes bacterium]|nr:hypothetical protein [Planctomycetota bacterium]
TVEVEVDRREQLDAVLPHGPDIVLLDNMSPAQLRDAVSRRGAATPAVELEASAVSEAAASIRAVPIGFVAKAHTLKIAQCKCWH